uniref:Uncharacterized protein n=1 Tax=Setaria viridis TaxID=4556 RepID=A0A4U6USA1_SETVI|nr:hypothetical protein SEVIR_4G009501v2 [Setaria viridis]
MASGAGDQSSAAASTATRPSSTPTVELHPPGLLLPH